MIPNTPQAPPVRAPVKRAGPELTEAAGGHAWAGGGGFDAAFVAVGAPGCAIEMEPEQM
jgi:hypothetical protein